MSLSAGTRLGVYEIVAPLGAGGMGEVYRARDTRLGRDVAIKCLPDLFAADPDRLMRFEREARTLASLNHLHIAQIYGLEHIENTRALVMELVEGEDLSERIARGPIPVAEALAIARQIVDALESAHNAGIIHRDLKPANIKVRDDGTVKVLDFGLAKAVEGAGRAGGAGGAGADGVLNSPTITTPAMTMQGIILGTAAYMSPEQAKGKPVDKRADVWSFGCVLYEMLTGKRAFDGDDVTDTLAAILRGEPDWSAITSLPPVVQMLLKRCIDRDTRRRIGDISAVRFVLDDPTVFVPAAPAAPAALAVPAVPAALAKRATLVLAALMVVAAVSALATWAWLGRTAAPTTAPVTRFLLPLPQGQVLAMSRRMVTVSPDGTMLAFVTENRLFVRRFSQFEGEAIPSDSGQGITSPAFSPDGTEIAFHVSSQSAIKRVSVAGGAAVRVCDMPAVPLSIDWDASGILLGLGSAGVSRCNPAGGPPEKLVTPKAGEAAISPQLLPDGKSILFTLANAADPRIGQWEAAQIVVQSLGSAERRVLVEPGVDGRVTPTGHLVYRSSGILYAVPFDVASRQIRGQAVSVVDGVMRASTGPTQMALSKSGTLVYVPGPTGAGTNDRQVTIGERSGATTALPLPMGPYVQARAAPDGQQVALASENSRDFAIWIYALDGKSALRRLTLSGRNRFPVWSPDSQWIAFQSNRDGDLSTYRQRADGTGTPERLTMADKGVAHIPESWSPDGKVISYAVVKTSTNAEFELWMLTLSDKKVSRVAGVSSAEPIGSAFSPDGKWLAYSHADDDDIANPSRGVYVRSFPGNDAVLQAPRQLVDFHAVWLPRSARPNGDGTDELIFLASVTARQMAATKVTASGAGLTFSTPVRFPATVAGDRLSMDPRSFDILPDGRFIGMVNASETMTKTGFAELRVVMNWFEELKQRVP